MKFELAARFIQMLWVAKVLTRESTWVCLTIILRPLSARWVVAPRCAVSGAYSPEERDVMTHPAGPLLILALQIQHSSNTTRLPQPYR